MHVLQCAHVNAEIIYCAAGGVKLNWIQPKFKIDLKLYCIIYQRTTIVILFPLMKSHFLH